MGKLRSFKKFWWNRLNPKSSDIFAFSTSELQISKFYCIHRNIGQVGSYKAHNLGKVLTFQIKLNSTVIWVPNLCFYVQQEWRVVGKRFFVKLWLRALYLGGLFITVVPYLQGSFLSSSVGQYWTQESEESWILSFGQNSSVSKILNYVTGGRWDHIVQLFSFSTKRTECW